MNREDERDHTRTRDEAGESGRKVAKARGERSSLGLTIHVDSLLLAKRGREILNFCREAPLDVLCC